MSSFTGRTLEALVTMTTKHLGTGSACPPLASGVLRCYSMKYCPYAQRTRMVLLAKNIKHELINVNMRAKPKWLFEKNPEGKVPILEQDGNLIYESLITCDYLEDLYPNRPLYPSDPFKKAQDRILVHQWQQVLDGSFKIYFTGGDPEKLQKTFEDIRKGLDIFETELQTRGAAFFGGEKPGMVDYMIWPWAERLPMAQKFAGDFGDIPEDRFPKMLQWMEDMKADPAVKETYLPLEDHVYFLTTFDSKAIDKKRKEASRL